MAGGEGMVGSTGGGGVGDVTVPGEDGVMVMGVKDGGEGLAESDATLGE